MRRALLAARLFTNKDGKPSLFRERENSKHNKFACGYIQQDMRAHA